MLQYLLLLTALLCASCGSERKRCQTNAANCCSVSLADGSFDGRVYDPVTEGCCRNGIQLLVANVYNLSTQMCCGDILPMVHSKAGQYCCPSDINDGGACPVGQQCLAGGGCS